MRTFNPIGALVLALTLFTVLLAGCQDTDLTENPPVETPPAVKATAVPTAEPTAEPTAAPTEAPTPTPVVEPVDLMDPMNTLTGWGAGSAGCSLKVVSAAHTLITWADENQAAQLNQDALQAGVALWLDTVPSDLQGSVKDTWLWVEDIGLQLLEKDPELELILGDIEKEYPESDTAMHNWVALCEAVDTVMEPIEVEEVDP